VFHNSFSLQESRNWVDVTLGSRLYNHLMALPMAYFESHQVGQNVARVRELDTIRNFITGTALPWALSGGALIW
jgi:subfamily B ATP-binding cassette protein HlyB/CyaB